MKTGPITTVILGLPGSGKTTFGTLLAKKNNCSFIKEPYEALRDKLIQFYNNELSGFDIQIAFLTEWARIYVTLDTHKHYVIDGGPILCIGMYTECLYELNKITKEEYEFINKLYKDYSLFNKFKDNCQYLFLDTSIEITHKRDIKRGRHNQSISLDYLKVLDKNLVNLVMKISDNSRPLIYVDNDESLNDCSFCGGKGFTVLSTYDEENNKPGPNEILECENCSGTGFEFNC